MEPANDILQQALAEVNPTAVMMRMNDDAATSVAKAGMALKKQPGDDILLLDVPVIFAGANAPPLDLANVTRPTLPSVTVLEDVATTSFAALPSAGSAFSAPSTSSGVKQTTTYVSPAPPSASSTPSSGSGMVTLQLTLDSARALGLDVAGATSSTTRPNLVLPPPLCSAPTSVTATSSALPLSDVILLPTTAPTSAATISYILHPSPPIVAASPAQIPVFSPSLSTHRPPNLTRTLPAPFAVERNQLMFNFRPVMSPAVVKTGLESGAQQRKQPQPLLPKPPAPNAALQQNGSATLARPKAVQAKKQSPLGSQANPFQLIHQGHTFHAVQPLNESQVLQLTNVLKKTGSEAPVEDSKIVIDKESNTRIMYKLIYPEDLDLNDLKAFKKSEHSAGKHSSDEDEDSEDANGAHPKIKSYYPHELWPDKKAMLRYLNQRKRGRPKRGTTVLEAPEVRAKKLRREFGLTPSQVQQVQADFDDDALVEVDHAKDDAIDEDDNDMSNLENEKQEVVTRSGRTSRPPVKREGENAATSEVAPAAKTDKRLFEPPPLVNENKPKRRFKVPERFRCRVCNKIYLGDRKMNRHVRLFPSHGPSEESLKAQAGVNSSVNSRVGIAGKMPEFSMPIIPMARTQLEELVKNLDAELVLDVVGKKMFDNFSMWQLEKKKISAMPEKGIKKLIKMFDDVEQMLCELKRVMDHCLSDTKLCSAESASRSVPTLQAGEFIQAAFNLHDGPWYLEQPNHIPDEYHKLLGIQAPILSPQRSDSTNPTIIHGDDDNSNSLLSLSSEKDTQHSIGAQLVLEPNLNAHPPMESDDDSRDCHSPKKPDSEVDLRSVASCSPASVVSHEEEDSNTNDHHDDLGHAKSANEENGVSELSSSAKNQLPNSSDLPSLEMDSSLGPFPSSLQCAPLPSFSTILGTQNSSESGAIVTPPPASQELSQLKGSLDDHGDDHGDGDGSMVLLRQQMSALIDSSPQRVSTARGPTPSAEARLATRSGPPSVCLGLTPDAESGLMTDDVADAEMMHHQVLPNSGPPSVGRHYSEEDKHLVSSSAIMINSLALSSSNGHSLSLGSTFDTSTSESHLPLLSDLEAAAPFRSLEKRRGSLPPSLPSTTYVPLPVGVATTTCDHMAAARATEADLYSQAGLTGLDAPLLIDSSILNPGLAGETSVTFVGCCPSTSGLAKDDPSRKATPGHVAAGNVAVSTNHAHNQDTSSNHFLSDLDSVLNDSADFAFPSALSNESLQLKTPDKILHSIPPSSMMMSKPAKSQLRRDQNGEATRTDFLGALSQPQPQQQQQQQEQQQRLHMKEPVAGLVDAEEPFGHHAHAAPVVDFDDHDHGALLASALGVGDDSFAVGTASSGILQQAVTVNDSLSSLFDEVEGEPAKAQQSQGSVDPSQK